MKRSIFFSILGILLLIFVAFSGQTVFAASGWATLTSVHDLTGGTSVSAGQPLIAGHAYNVTLSISVPFNETNSQFQVSLNPAMGAQTGQFWYVQTPGYAGYNASAFTAGDKTVSFSQVQGQLVVSTEFQIPVNLTMRNASGVLLDIPQNSFQLVTVSVSGGSSQVGNITLSVQDQNIVTYLNTYQQDSTLVSSGKIDKAYSSIVNNILSQSQALYSAGLATQATSLLGTLTSSTFPAPPNNSTSTYLGIALVVVVIIAIVFALMAVRRRGQSGSASTVITDVQRELAMLEVTATRYDKSMAEKIKALREKLNDAT